MIVLLTYSSECAKQWDPTFHTSGDSYLNASAEPKSCVCKDGFEFCPSGASGPPMPYMITQANNYLYNITGTQLDTDDYLLISQQEFLHRCVCVCLCVHVYVFTINLIIIMYDLWSIVYMDVLRSSAQ